MEVGVGNARRTASVVGNADEVSVVEIVVAVVEVDVGVADTKLTQVGDLFIRFVLCQKKGGGLSHEMGSREPLTRSPTPKRRWTGGAMGDQSFFAPSHPSSQRRCLGAVDTL